MSIPKQRALDKELLVSEVRGAEHQSACSVSAAPPPARAPRLTRRAPAGRAIGVLPMLTISRALGFSLERPKCAAPPPRLLPTLVPEPRGARLWWEVRSTHERSFVHRGGSLGEEGGGGRGVCAECSPERGAARCTRPGPHPALRRTQVAHDREHQEVDGGHVPARPHVSARQARTKPRGRFFREGVVRIHPQGNGRRVRARAAVGRV